jgi:DNA-binding IclR family transcriptional regulator
MAGSQIERAFSLVESLAGEPQGLPLQTLAERLDIPKSAAHRMLTELVRLGYVRQNRESSRYQLSAKLVAQGFRYLASSGADIIQPILDRLAQDSGELVRLGVIDGARQTWIAKSQGARSGLRYDPDMGRDAPLFYTASGHAWLASLNDEQALQMVLRQGIADPASSARMRRAPPMSCSPTCTAPASVATPGSRKPPPLAPRPWPQWCAARKVTRSSAC